MEVGSCIKGRRTIRKYSSIPVPIDKIMAVLEAGNYAPCAGNIQNWSFVLVTDYPTKVKIAEACLNQDWMVKATAHIVIVNDKDKTLSFYSKMGGLYSSQNCACAAMNMLLMAHSLKLGAAWVGGFPELVIKEIIGIPEEETATPEIIIAVGYPDEVPEVPEKRNLKDVVFIQEWDNKETPEVTLGEINRDLVENSGGLVEHITKAAKEKLSESVKEPHHSKNAAKSKKVAKPVKKGSLDDNVPPAPPKKPNSYY